MNTIRHIGPGGKDGCCRFNCLVPAVVEYHYEVKFPGGLHTNIISPFCAEHDKPVDPLIYPTHTLIKKVEL